MTDLIISSKTFLAKSLGCRTNQAEIESISIDLLNHGFKPENSKKAPDIILLNTCVVTSKAEKETRKEMRNLRKKFPKAFMVVLGCAVTEKEKFKIDLPEADLLISNEEKYRTTELIEQFFTSKNDLKNQMINKYTLSGRKFIKIQDGCNNFCSFCLTSLLRGKPVSVLPVKIIDEVNFWVEREIKEAILTGINIGLYNVIASEAWQSQPTYSNPTGLLRRPADGGIPRNDIILLLNKILSETKIERLTFSSIYPEMLADNFLTLVVGNSRITQCFHLSLQSGSQTVLERMNRKTKLDELFKKLQWIKLKNPFFTFRADIITGFPEESEKEFQETLDFIKSSRISFVHIFTFSPRKGTLAYEMIKSRKWQDLSESVKKERSEKIRSVVEKTREEEGKIMIDRSFQCLIIRKINYHDTLSFRASAVSRGIPSPRRTKERDPSTSVGMTMYEGITENGWPILISSKQQVVSSKGKMIKVKITSFEDDYLIGEITALPTKGTNTSGISTEPSAF